MNILMLGYGVTGKAVEAFCQTRGHRFSVYEAGRSLKGVDLIVKSPGIPLDHPLVLQQEIPVTTEIDLALDEIHGKTLYAITGSNGKTTTTLLTTHLLKCAGKKALACGNVGRPLISAVDSDAEVLVIELSSFQLASMRLRPVFDKGVILNITPNHIDWHKGFAAYAEAKLRLAQCLKQGAPLYTNQEIATRFDLDAHVFPVEPISSLRYRNGRVYAHEGENIAAAKALTGTLQGIESFERPPHRLENVRDIDGVAFVNDSKATSIDAVTKAVEAIDTPVVLLVGGVDKGSDYSLWLPSFGQKVKQVIAFGQAANKIAAKLAPSYAVTLAPSLEEGVKQAHTLAKPGETVLLSPGCSSFDQFVNFEHRGDRFKELVLEISV